MSLGALIEKFRVIALDRVEKMNLLMVQLERDLEDSAVVEELMREVHTLKGEANMMGFADINLVAHQVEHLLLAITAQSFEGNRINNDLVFEGLDLMRQLLTKSVGGDDFPADLAGFVDRVAAARVVGAVGLSETVEISEVSEALEGVEQSEDFGGLVDADESVEKTEAEQAVGSHATQAWQQRAVESEPQSSTRTRIQSTQTSAVTEEKLSGNAKGASEVQLRVQGDSSLRVELDKLEYLGDTASEVLLLSRRFEHRLSELEEIRRDLRSWMRENAGGLPKSQQLVMRNMVHRLDALETRLGEEAYLVVTRAGHMDEQSRRLRHVPLAQVLSHYPRAMRDLARSQGKRVRLVYEFGDVEVDRAALSVLSEPLLHLIRNAVDHGIELPEERARAGKDEEGEIGLKAEYEGDGIRVVLYDDGRGIDPALVREKAVERGLMTEEQAGNLSDQAAIGLIFEPGFTTREVVSEMSGRGVGLDVVRRQISRRSGYVEVESEVGKGTKFMSHLPLSSVVNSVLMIAIGGEHFAVTASNVERVEVILVSDIRRVHGRMNVYLDRELIPFVDWKDLLGLSDRGGRLGGESGELRVLIIKKGLRRAAVLIDEVIGEREALTRPLGEFLSGVGLCQGIALTAASEVLPMLNVLELLMRVEAESGPVHGSVMGLGVEVTENEAGVGALNSHVKTILVVEDSEVTRALVSSVLRDEGYLVLEAGDGLQGMAVLGKNRVDLVLSDVQMPHMDGLALLRSIRETRELAGVPVIMLSMLGEPEDKERAMALGANGYIVKLHFSEKALLQAVRRWL